MHGPLNVKPEEWSLRFQLNSGHHPCVSPCGAILRTTTVSNISKTHFIQEALNRIKNLIVKLKFVIF